MNLCNIAVLAALALGCAVPACARDGEPALRLPGESGLGTATAMPSLSFRFWAQGVSERLALMARPRLPELQWRGDGVSRSFTRIKAERPLLVERTRTAITAQWRPLVAGPWVLGATMGVHRSLPGTHSGSPGFAAMPTVGFEQPNYRVNLGLLPPSRDRDAALMLGLTVSLR